MVISILILVLQIQVCFAQYKIFEARNGNVSFHSNAQHELIYASSDHLTGILDATKKIFSFRISISSFAGFNNSLQQEHFNENYMETSLYPLATFSGKIIEDIDLSKDGDYMVRAKGKFTIHGIEQERIVRSHILIKDGKLYVKSSFDVLLAEYNIKIPRIVSDKLSPVISVSVNCVMTKML